MPTQKKINYSARNFADVRTELVDFIKQSEGIIKRISEIRRLL